MCWTDNIWADQNLELDSDLPSGWRTIRDSTGTYYWHVPTGTTQWQHPSYSAEDEQNAINGITASNLKVNTLETSTVPEDSVTQSVFAMKIIGCFYDCILVLIGWNRILLARRASLADGHTFCVCVLLFRASVLMNNVTLHPG